MPRLPLHFLEADPSVGRARRGVVQVPTARTPLLNPNAAGATAEAVAGLGRDLDQVGDVLLHTQELKARQQRAQNLLDAQQATQAYRGDVNTAYDELRTEVAEGRLHLNAFDTELERRTKDVEFQYAETLTPGARQRFAVEAQAYRNTLLPKVRDFTFQIQEQQRQTLLLGQIEDYTRGIADADDPETRQYYQTQLDTLVADWQTVALLGPEEAAKLVRTATDSAALQTWRQDMQTDPAGTLTRLRTMQQDGTDLVGGVPIADVIDEAHQRQRQTLLEARQDEAYREQLQQKAQGRHAGGLRSRLYALDPTAENLPAFRALLQEANQAFAADRIGEEDHANLVRSVRSFLNTSLRDPIVRDDPVVEKQLRLAVEFSDRPEDLHQARWRLQEHAGDVTPETLSALNRRIEQRLDTTNWRNLDEVRDAREYLGRVAYPSPQRGGMSIAEMVLLGSTDPANKQVNNQLAAALDALDQRLDEAAEQGITAVRRQALPAAREIRSTYFPAREEAIRGVLGGPSSTSQLPLELDPQRSAAAPTDEASARRKIAELATRNPDYADVEAQRTLFEAWQAAWAAQQQFLEEATQ